MAYQAADSQVGAQTHGNVMGTLLRTPLLYSPFKPVALLKKLRLLVANLSFNVPIASEGMGWGRCIGSILFAALNVL